MLTKLTRWLNGPPPEPAPSPSDIIAGIVAQRIVASPETVTLGYCYGNWFDEQSGITVKMWRWDSSGTFDVQSLKHRDKELAPTRKGKDEIEAAFVFAAQHQKATAVAKAKYDGDMAACEAIESMFGEKP